MYLHAPKHKTKFHILLEQNATKKKKHRKFVTFNFDYNNFVLLLFRFFFSLVKISVSCWTVREVYTNQKFIEKTKTGINRIRKKRTKKYDNHTHLHTLEHRSGRNECPRNLASFVGKSNRTHSHAHLQIELVFIIEAIRCYAFDISIVAAVAAAAIAVVAATTITIPLPSTPLVPQLLLH